MPNSTPLPLESEVSDLLHQPLDSFVKKASFSALKQCLLAEKPIEDVVLQIQATLNEKKDERIAASQAHELEHFLQQQFDLDSTQEQEDNEREYLITSECRKLEGSIESNKCAIDGLKRQLPEQEKQKVALQQQVGELSRQIRLQERDDAFIVADKLRIEKKLTAVQKNLSDLQSQKQQLEQSNRDMRAEIQAYQHEQNVLIPERRKARELRVKAQQSGEQATQACFSDTIYSQFMETVRNNNRHIAAEHREVEQAARKAMYGCLLNVLKNDPRQPLELKNIAKQMQKAHSARQQRNQAAQALTEINEQLKGKAKELKRLQREQMLLNKKKDYKTFWRNGSLLFAGLLVACALILLIPVMATASLIPPLIFFAGLSILVAAVSVLNAVLQQRQANRIDEQMRAFEEQAELGISERQQQLIDLEQAKQEKETEYETLTQKAAKAKEKAEKITERRPSSPSSSTSYAPEFFNSEEEQALSSSSKSGEVSFTPGGV